MRVALYVRVSTAEQTHEHQRRELQAEAERRGWDVAATYADVATGTNTRRPELARLRHDAALSRFRTVVVWSIDRLGRSTLEVLGLAQELRGRGVGLVSLREPAIDTTGPMGELVLAVFAAVASFERARLVERTHAGIETARRKGKRLGRPSKVPSAERLAFLLDANGGNRALTARQLGVSTRTVERAAKALQGDKKGTPESSEVPAAKPRLFALGL